MRPVINATGVHTNLGRDPLSQAAVRAVTVAAGATNVELDLDETGRAGPPRLLCAHSTATAVPAAEGVHVVNNGAAALALVTCVLAGEASPRRRVVVARGLTGGPDGVLLVTSDEGGFSVLRRRSRGGRRDVEAEGSRERRLLVPAQGRWPDRWV